LNFQNTWCGQPPNPTQQFEGFKYVGELGHCRSSMWLWLGRQFHVYQWAKQKKINNYRIGKTNADAGWWTCGGSLRMHEQNLF
jgi:hypothetical protein